MIMINFIVALLIFLIVVFAVYVFVLVRPRVKKPEDSSLLTEYAHRGLHGGDIPENSLAAFEKAVQNGFGIELDVQLSLDNVVCVFHDYNLKRMTGCEKLLCEMTYSELEELKLANTEQKIPTLEQVLSLVNGKVPLLVELKGESFDTSLCKKTADVLSKYSGAYCIESFNPLLIKDIKKYLPNVFCGQLYTNVCREKKKFSFQNAALTLMALNFLAKPDFIAYDKKDRSSFPVKLTTKFFKAFNFVWTIKGEKELEQARKLKEYSIFEK